MASVQLEHILKHYDSLEGVTLTGYKGPPALDNVDLIIEDGETISIVGPSGCGKSTMLKVVSGLEYPNKGKGNLAYYFEMHAHTPEETEASVKETANLMGMGFERLLHGALRGIAAPEYHPGHHRSRTIVPV